MRNSTRTSGQSQGQSLSWAPMRVLHTIAFLTFSLCFSSAQQSDLYLVQLDRVGSSFEISRPQLLSGFNPGGYTNQPAFVDHHRLLVSAGPREEMQATDIYELDLRSQKIRRITKTEDREYSPRPAPDGMISCVVVEVEADDNQCLWQYPGDLSGGGKALLPQANDVGYYCALRDGWMAVFEVGEPNRLFLYDAKAGSKHFISENVGRCLQRTGDGSLIYVHKFSEDYSFLKKVSVDSLRPMVVKKTIPNGEDFVIVEDSYLLMGRQSKLYCLDLAGDNTWRELADLGPMGIQQITRLAHNGVNKLAIVTSPVSQP